MRSRLFGGLAAAVIVAAVTVVPSTLVAPSAGAATPTQKAIRKWYKKAEPALKTLETDAEQLSREASNVTSSGDLSSFRQACNTYGLHAEQAQKMKPVPDLRAEGNWREGLAHISDGAQSCVAGVAAVDANLIVQAGHEFTSAYEALRRLTARVTKIMAKPSGTSTYSH